MGGAAGRGGSAGVRRALILLQRDELLVRGGPGRMGNAGEDRYWRSLRCCWCRALSRLSLSLSLSLHMLQMLAVHCNDAGASLSRGETRPDLLGSEAFDKLASRASHQPPKVNYRPLIQNGEIPLTVHVRMYLPGNFTTLKQGSMVHFRWLVEALGYLLRDFRIFLKEKPLDERSPSTSASISLHLYYYRHGLCRFLTPPLATRR